MSEEFINPSQPKNRYIYSISRDWNNPEIIHILKYPIIYSNKTMTYFKMPGSDSLGSVYSINIMNTLEEVSNILARDRKFCSIFCLENPGHTFEDKENLLGRAKRKKDLVQKLDALNKEKINIENQIRGLIAKKEFNASDISKIEKEIKKIDGEVLNSPQILN